MSTESFHCEEEVSVSFNDFWKREVARLVNEEENRSKTRRDSFKMKQAQARNHTATIFKLLQQSRLCTSCNQQMDQHSVFSVRPHLICDSEGQRLICGKCHREGDHGEKVVAFMYQTFPGSGQRWGLGPKSIKK